MPDRVRQDDQFRDPTTPARPEVQIGQVPDALRLDTDDVIVTDPTAITVSKTYPVAAQATATNTVAPTPAVPITDDNAKVTAVTYTPAGAQAAPAAGSSRTWTVTGAEGTIATLTFQNGSAALVNGTPVAFTLSVTQLGESQTLNFASSIAGSGVADPGGTLTVTYTI